MPPIKSKIQIRSSLNVAAQNFKKVCIHGESGCGKTMLAATAAPFKPIIILTERTGDESLHPDNIAKVFGAGRSDILYEIPIIEAFEPAEFEEAVNFVTESSDYDLVIFDSLSKASRLILKGAKGDYKDGRKAYGAHNDAAMDLLEMLVAGDKHVVAICHTSRTEDSDSGEVVYAPGFEGKAFTEKSVYDWPHVVFLDTFIDNDGHHQRVLRCHKGDSNKRCKNRGGLLDEFEEPHLGRLLQKLSGSKPSLKKKPKA